MTQEERLFSFPNGDKTSRALQIEQEREERAYQQELHESAEVKIESKIFILTTELQKWENTKPYFALSQDMIDGVLDQKRREIEVYTYILNQL